MIATVILEGAWKVSKQNSYLARPHGGRYKNPAYAAEQERIYRTIAPQLRAQGWKCTKNLVDLKIIFFGPCLPCDWDNCGLLTDVLQGPTTKIGKKRVRGPGLVVWDDRQFIPATVAWFKSDRRQIIIAMRETEATK